MFTILQWLSMKVVPTLVIKMVSRASQSVEERILHKSRLEKRLL